MARGYGEVIVHRFVTVDEPPPNKGMDLTGESVTPFARGRAKRAPLSPAAELNVGRHWKRK